MKKKLFLQEESGQAMVEYGLIIAVLSTAVLGLLGGIGNVVKNMYLDPVLNGFKGS